MFDFKVAKQQKNLKFFIFSVSNLDLLLVFLHTFAFFICIYLPFTTNFWFSIIYKVGKSFDLFSITTISLSNSVLMRHKKSGKNSILTSVFSESLFLSLKYNEDDRKLFTKTKERDTDISHNTCRYLLQLYDIMNEATSYLNIIVCS